MHLQFDEAKATQAAAFFLQLRGGQMHYIKLIKLLYLADREAQGNRMNVGVSFQMRHLG